MKKLAVLLAAVMTIAFTGCGSNSTPSPLVTYVARASTDSWAPHPFVLDPSTQKGTAVAISIPTTAEFVSFNSDATVAVYGRSDAAGVDVFLMGTDNQEKQLTTDGNSENPAISPDGKTVAYTNQWDGYEQIATVNADGSNQKVLYASGTSFYQYFPEFSPDGKSLVFFVELAGGDTAARVAAHAQHKTPRSHGRNLSANNSRRGFPGVQGTPTQTGWYVMALTDTAPTFVYAPSDWWGPAVFSTDGKGLLFTDYDGTEYNVYSVNLDGTGVTELTTSTSGDDFAPVPYKSLIFFNHYNSTTESFDIYVMDQTGANQTLVNSTASTYESLVDAYWQED